MSRRVLAGLLCVVVMAGALGCAYFGGGGLTPAQQLELLEGDVA